MELNVNDTLHGFRVTRVRYIEDCSANMIEMVHEKTGAELVYLNRSIENMTFSIAFKTLPENHTGVFHILEHSVLNGSKKYPVREPFVDLLKGSMQTFLNAMTYPDKTMYPVASRNKKDFLNLVSVYLDAVFAPAIYENPNIFYQEGWRYEIRNREDAPIFNGVVFNEMKGAYSSVDEVISDNLQRLLFTNTYHYSSGGDPVHIPELSYEEFINTHRKFYHPSNARVFLDGTIDLDTILAKIDEDYFAQYEKEDFDFTIPMQEMLPAREEHTFYEVSPGESVEGRTQVAFGKIYGAFNDVDKVIGWQVLSSLLTGSNEAPLKKAILEKGLGEDVEFAIYDGIQQPFYILLVRNSDVAKKEEIISTIKDTVHGLVEKGLEHSKIKASLNQMEFRYREQYEPSGVMNADDALKAWLYEGDPALYLNCGSMFETLRQQADEGYFEKLLSEGLEDWDHIVTLVAEPSATLGAERVEKEAEVLRQAKEAWGDEIDTYIALNETLDAWQQQPDTPEAIATLPKLELSDVEVEPTHYEPDVQTIKNIPVLVYPEENKGITYLNLYFNLAGLKKEQLPSVALYASMLTDLPTKNKSVEQLQEEIRSDLGSLNFSTTSVSAENSTDKAIPLLTVNCSVLNQNIDKAIALILEILQETQFDKDSIRPLVAQTVEGNRQTLIGSGHAVALIRCNAQLTAAGAAAEAMSGYESLKWVNDFNTNYETAIEGFIEDAYLYQNVLNNRNRLMISVTGEDHVSDVEKLITSFPNEAFERSVVHYPLLDKEKSGIVIPASISYAATGMDLNGFGLSYSGPMRVLSHILTFDYLWNEVRVKGGAYGTGFQSSTAGTVASFSYRDPNPKNTLEVEKKIGAHLKTWLQENPDLTTYIIGAIASGDPLLSPGAKVRAADARYMSGVDYAFRARNRKEILSTTKEDLMKIAEVLEKALQDTPTCVVGTEEVLVDLGLPEVKILKIS